MTYTYRTRGTCSSRIDIELDGDVIRSVAFTGGCNGNLQGISRLVQGMPAEEAIRRLRGIRCGSKPTSCPDQLSFALEEALRGAAQAGCEKQPTGVGAAVDTAAPTRSVILARFPTRRHRMGVSGWGPCGVPRPRSMEKEWIR